MASRDDGVGGVCFRLSLPLELPTPGPSHSGGGRARPTNDDSVLRAGTTTPGTPAQQQPLGLHVLVVDDSATNRRIAERMLRGMGCTCSLAEDGDEVVDALGAEAFDVLLLDIRMARMNGDAACKELRAIGYTLPVVAVTGNATRADAEGYSRVGFNATLGKPAGAEGVSGGGRRRPRARSGH